MRYISFVTLLLSLLLSTSAFAQYEKSSAALELGYNRVFGDFSRTASGGLTLGLDIREEIYPHIRIGAAYQMTYASNVNSPIFTNNWSTHSGEIKMWFHRKSVYDFYSPKGFNPFIGFSLGFGVINEPFSGTVDGSKSYSPNGSVEIGTEYRHYTFSYRFRYMGDITESPVFHPRAAGVRAIGHSLVVAWRFRTDLTIRTFFRELIRSFK